MIVKHDPVLADEREADIDGGSSLPSAGRWLYMMFFRTSDSTLHVWNGSTWVEISGGGGASTAGEAIGLLLTLTKAS